MARILVIDDDEQIRSVLRRALEGEGHEVLEAGDGTEALRLHRATPADLVITDILMPKKDGLEVLLALRRGSPRLKVIAMSGGGRHGQMTSLEAARPLGAFASLSKPFKLDAMIEAVRRALAA
jgi:DNA-binding NtrC family response regulator